MQLDMSGVLNISQMVATIVAFFVLDRVGRKPPLIFGSVCNTICHVIVAVIMAKFSHDWVKYHNEAWVAVAFILIFMFTFGVGWSPVPWAMRKCRPSSECAGCMLTPCIAAEVHSSSRRAKGVAITTCACWLCNFIIGLITPLCFKTSNTAHSFSSVSFLYFQVSGYGSFAPNLCELLCFKWVVFL